MFRIGSRVASGVPKQSLLGSFGAPFGRVWDDVLEHWLRFEYPFLRYALDIPKELFEYSSGFIGRSLGIP